MTHPRHGGRNLLISGPPTVTDQESIMLAKATGRSPALAAGALALVLGTPLALATTERGRASATIVQGIVVTEAVPMSFAAVAPPPSGGAIVLSTAGTIQSPGGLPLHRTPPPGAFHHRGLPHHPPRVRFRTGNPVTRP